MKKITIIFLMIINVAFSIDAKVIHEFEYEDDGSYFYVNGLSIIKRNVYDKTLTIADFMNNLDKQYGGSGSGPGEFESLLCPKIFNNKLYAFDNSLYRLTIFDLNSENIEIKRIPIYLRMSHNFKIESETIYIFGPNKKKFFDPREECFLITKSNIGNDEVEVKKNFINVGEELSQYDNSKKYYPKNWHSDSRLKSVVPSGYCKFAESGNSFVILYPYIGDFFIFDYKTEETKRVIVDFPGYENPTGKNYYKNWKKYSEEQEDFMIDYCFNPKSFIYDDVKKQYRVVYNIPKNLRKNHSCVEVVFDSNFQYVSKENLDDGIWRYSKHDGRIYMLNQNREEMTVKIYELEQ